MGDFNSNHAIRVSSNSNRINFNTHGVFNSSVISYDHYVEPDYNTLNYDDNSINDIFLSKNKKILEEISILAQNDSQINTIGIFDKFTDFQNTMLADMSLLELLWENSGENISGKTIGQLYVENLGDNSKIEDYENLTFTGDDWFNMANSENWDEYRSKVLGKLVRYGFGNIKIKEIHHGENGFDAYVLEDLDGNLMVYYPCTNIVETDDFLYDLYNICSVVSKNGDKIGKLITAEKIYNSQQQQAKDFLNKYVSQVPEGKKINVFGFSLGGGLAEVSYLNAMDNDLGRLGDIVLYNPYHDNLSSDDANKLVSTNKLKIYACEGDMASTVFNYSEFMSSTKPIYINSVSSMSNAKVNIDNNNSLANKVLNYIKNDYCNNLIDKINEKKGKMISWDLVSQGITNETIDTINKFKAKNLDVIDAIKDFGAGVKNIVNLLDKIGILESEKYNLVPFDNLHYMEYIFTDTHLPYAVDAYKNISFDANGNVLKDVMISGEKHNVSYPSFAEESTNLFGVDIYTTVTDYFNDH